MDDRKCVIFYFTLNILKWLVEKLLPLDDEKMVE